jgi:hypothetical protein
LSNFDTGKLVLVLCAWTTEIDFYEYIWFLLHFDIALVCVLLVCGGFLTLFTKLDSSIEAVLTFGVPECKLTTVSLRDHLHHLMRMLTALGPLPFPLPPSLMVAFLT